MAKQIKLKKILEGTKAEILKEEYIESMDHKAIDKHLSAIEMQWLDWKRGSMTEKSDIKPAGAELTHYILLWMRKKFK